MSEKELKADLNKALWHLGFTVACTSNGVRMTRQSLAGDIAQLLTKYSEQRKGEPCPRCHGKGWLGLDCDECNGKGVQPCPPQS